MGRVASSDPDLGHTRQGWNRSDCLVCHQPGLMAHHQGLTEPQCQGCHGDNGTAPGYERCVVCHGVPRDRRSRPAPRARRLAVTCDTCHAGAGIEHADRHRNGIAEVSLDPRFGGSYAPVPAAAFPATAPAPSLADRHQPRLHRLP